MSIKIGTISISLTAETASFQTGMEKASQVALNSSKNIEKSFNMMAGAISAATGAAIGALGLLIDKTEETVFAMQRMAAQSGTSIEQFSKLAYAAKLAGTPVEDMSRMLERISRSSFEAASGNKQAASAYRELGVSVTDAGGKFKTADQIAVELAKSLNQYRDSAAKTGIEMLLMGRSGAQAADFMSVLATRFDEVSDKASRLGVVFNRGTANEAQKLHDSFVDLEEAGLGLSVRLLSNISPALDQLAAKIVDFVSNAENMKKLDELGTDIAHGVEIAGNALEFLIKHADTVKLVLEALAGIRLAGMFGPMILSATEASGVMGKMGVASVNLIGNLLGIRRMGTIFAPIAREAAQYASTLGTLAKEEGIAQTATLALGDATVSVKALMAALSATVVPAALAAGAVYSFGMAIKGVHDYNDLQKETGASWWAINKTEIEEATSSAENFLGYLKTIAGFKADSAHFYSDVAARLGKKPEQSGPSWLHDKITKTYDESSSGKKDLHALPQDEKIDPLAKKLDELVNKAHAAQQALALVGADPDAQRKVEIEEKYNQFLIDEKLSLDKLTPSRRSATEAIAHAAIVTQVNIDALTKYRTELFNLSQSTASSIQDHLAMAAAIGKSAQAMQDAAVTAQVAANMQRIGGAGWRNNPQMVADAQKMAQNVRDQINSENREADAKSLDGQQLQIDAQQRLNDAIFQGADARRQAALASEQAAIRSDFANRKDTDTGAMQAQLDAAQRRSDLEKQAADRQRAVSLNPAQAFRDQEQALADAVKAAKEYGVAIDYKQVLAADMEAWKQFQQAQDKALLETGGFMDGLRVALNQIALDTASNAKFMADAVGEAVNTMNDALARLMTAATSHQPHAIRNLFAGGFRNVGESLAKSSLQKLEGSALQKLGLGGAQKPDGSQSKPFWVKSADHKSSAGAGGQGNSDGQQPQSISGMVQGWFSKFLHGFGGQGGQDSGAPSLGFDPSDMDSTGGWGNVASIFHGYADGGTFDGSSPIWTGERGPELIVPSASGTVVPNHRLGEMGSGDQHFHIDARGAHNEAATIQAIHNYMTHAAPKLISKSVGAVQEQQRRTPRQKI